MKTTELIEKAKNISLSANCAYQNANIDIVAKILKSIKRNPVSKTDSEKSWGVTKADRWTIRKFIKFLESKKVPINQLFNM